MSGFHAGQAISAQGLKKNKRKWTFGKLEAEKGGRWGGRQRKMSKIVKKIKNLNFGRVLKEGTILYLDQGIFYSYLLSTYELLQVKHASFCTVRKVLADFAVCD